MIAERIRESRKRLKMSGESLGKVIGVSKSTISQWENGNTQPSGVNLTLLCKALKTTPEWILYGKGSPAAETSSSEMASIRPSGVINISWEVLMGDGGCILSKNPHEGYVTSFGATEKSYAVKIHGDSLWPRVNDGEVIVISPDIEVTAGDEVYVLLSDGSEMLKRIYSISADRIQLIEIAKREISPSTYNKSSITLISKITAIISPDLISL
ncbi:helix-turn-helix domain-containing protein [Raoultella ornithinolytica]|uniref:helix-turn-helix domain-containing protein n=1 Tax=Raoultella ornithinolytica TaxID=54291 RepID=UPI002FF05A99